MSLSSSSSSSLSTAGRGAGPCPEPVSIDRLQGSSLKDSAIARLLLKGRLTDKAAVAAAATVRAAPSAAATAADTARVLTPPPPMDLSTTNRTTKHIGINNTSFSLTTITTMERLRYILGCEIQSLLYRLSGSAPSSPLTVVDSQDDPGGGLLHHACRLCPYVASMAVELLVHYRSHNDNLAHLGQKSPDVLSAWFGYYLKASTLGGSMSTPGEPRGQPGSPRPLNCPVQSSSSSSRLDLRELLLKPMKATSMTSDDLSLTPCRLRPPSASSILLLKSMGSKMAAAAAADELSRSRSSTPYTTISIATDEDNNNHHHYHHHHHRHQQALYQHNDDHHHQQQHPHAKRTTNGRQRAMTYYCRDDDDVTSASRVVKCEFADDVTRSPLPVRSPPMSSCSEKEEEEEEDQEDEDEEEEKSGNDSRCCCSSSLEGVGSGRFCNGRGAGADRSPPTLKREIVKEEEEEDEERKGPPRDCGGGGGGVEGSAFGGGFDCGGGRVTANRLLLRGESPRRNGTATSSSPTSPEISSNFHRRNPRTGSGSHPPGAGDGVQQQPRSSSNENHCDVTDSSITAAAAAAAAAAAGRQCQSPPDNSGGEPAELRYAYKQYKRLRKNSAPRSFRPASSSSLPVLGRGDGGGGGGGGGAGSSVPRGHDPEEATPGGHRQNDELIAKEEEGEEGGGGGGGGGGGRPEDSRNNYIDVAVQCDLIAVDTQPPSCKTGHQQWEGEEMEEEEEEGEEDEQEEEDGVAVRVPCQASRCCRLPRKRTFPADETTTTDVTASDANFLLRRRRSSRSRLRRRCSPCGITFDDDVIFSIHMGCHSHAHPFVCNVCGRQCENKYGFNTHVLRGHHPT